MDNKEQKIIVINAISSFFSIGLLVGAFFVKDVQIRKYIIIAALISLIIQKIIDIAIIKQTRKASIVILVVIIILLIYFALFVK
ncbi:hypothetical protein HZY83_02700 [Gemella sp. GH3]|uniref:hypothetical protein n=1 Tax=unclassified Gemella TaxID=2624949 RepID=UPI0015D03DA0|nr:MULTISPECIES: hypothetical protein [unclassified Gemella]MBF0713590.1 hypothetical protein [Gemella sp. GH3.1]NYS50542.1 hypothetical protein [Gemella sp. GH3]